MQLIGGEERIDVYTTLLRDGSLFYVLGVAPRDEYSEYEPAFKKVVDAAMVNSQS